MTTIALVGNPNSGKSTLFNALTKSHQKIGNWPGVTVERKHGSYRHDGEKIEVIDLPGLYDIESHDSNTGEDEKLVREFLQGDEADVYVNVVDANSLHRGLVLSTQLREFNRPLIIALTMMDVAKRDKTEIDFHRLSETLGCPVIPLVAKRGKGIDSLYSSISAAAHEPFDGIPGGEDRYGFVNRVVSDVLSPSTKKTNITEAVDRIVLNRWIAFPLFLLAMYLMFFFSINVGSAFIDFFDLLGEALFVEGPRQVLSSWNTPSWLTAFICDGVGGGIQLTATFVPVIGALFLFLTVLEDSGYMSRVAFILDKPMRMLGLPGKAVVPLIVGFGCNVPSVLGVRNVENRPDRILTTIMAPFMSCGARLTVYALFVSAFFAAHGQNIVFALYLLGIAVALLSAWSVRKYLIPPTTQSYSHELPSYHLPTVRGLLTHTWHRLKGFVVRAGKAIVLVVIVLNMASTIGIDGSIGNQDKENSVLSAIGRVITPAFHPMGIDRENWPATVGIFTGMFAKEVVVGTLDTLYTPDSAEDEPFRFGDTVVSAFTSVPSNFSDLGNQLADPLGIGVDSHPSPDEAASENEVAINTIVAMQSLFDGKLGAFSYLVFILLYMPCVATIGAIYKELGAFWAGFSTAWSFVIAYSAAVVCYQLGNISSHPVEALITLGVTIALTFLIFALLVFWGRRKAPEQDRLIQVTQVT